MTKPVLITFTGIDARTDLGRVREMSARWPIEWGILFSPKRQKTEPRYPDFETIDRFRTYGFGEDQLYLAAHLCGGHAVGIMEGKLPRVDLSGFSRAQVNHTNPDPVAIAEFARQTGVEAITQWRQTEFSPDDSVSWLFDRSGGRGEEQTYWPPHPGGDRFVGYAGGLGPETVTQAVAKIAQGNPDGRPYWIDMESRVRTDDWLDLNKCEAVCLAVFGD